MHAAAVTELHKRPLSRLGGFVLCIRQNVQEDYCKYLQTVTEPPEPSPGKASPANNGEVRKQGREEGGCGG